MTIKNKNAKIYATNGKTGLDMFLDISGCKHYLYSRKSNGLIYVWMKDGITIGELSRVKPDSNAISQKKFHYAKRILQIVHEYFEFELLLTERRGEYV